ncbi:MAG: YihY/virulence factor BrkB family protein [Terracidiphilus sp.]
MKRLAGLAEVDAGVGEGNLNANFVEFLLNAAVHFPANGPLLNGRGLPDQAASFFVGTYRHVASGGRRGLLTFGAIFTVWSGSTGVYALMEQLNVICDVKERRPFWKARGIAILLLVLFALLAIGALSLVIFGGVLQSSLASIIGWSRPLLVFFATLRWIIIAAALLLAIAVSYRFGPDVKVRFRFISSGNLAAAILILLASIAFRSYVSKFGNYSATYGSLAAIIILMLWMYMAGIALLTGYEVNAVLHPYNSQQSELDDSGRLEEIGVETRMAL